MWHSSKLFPRVLLMLFFVQPLENFADQPLTADLELSVTSSSTSVPWGTNVTFSVLVTNKGPVAARDLVLTNFFSGVIIRTLSGSEPDDSRTFLSPNILRQTRALLQPGESMSLVALVLPDSPGSADASAYLAATNDSTPGNNIRWASVSVLPATNGISEIAIPAIDSAYDSSSRRLFLYDRTGMLWSISPHNSGIFPPVSIGPRGLIALAPGGTSLYVGMHTGGVTRLDAPFLTPVTITQTNFNGVTWDLEVSPIDPALLAISTSTGTKLFTNGTPLAGSVTNFGNISFTADGAKLILQDQQSCALHILNVSATGLTLDQISPAISCQDFDLWDGKLYFHDGKIYDLSSGAQSQVPGMAPGTTAVADQTVINTVVHTNNVWTLRRLDRDTFATVQTLPHPVRSPFYFRQVGEDDLVAYDSEGAYWVNLSPESARLRAYSRRGSGTVGVRAYGLPGRRYQLQRTFQLNPPDWRVIAESSDGLDEQVFPYGLTFPTNGFFRVITLP